MVSVSLVCSMIWISSWNTPAMMTAAQATISTCRIRKGVNVSSAPASPAAAPAATSRNVPLGTPMSKVSICASCGDSEMNIQRSCTAPITIGSSADQRARDGAGGRATQQPRRQLVGAARGQQPGAKADDQQRRLAQTHARPR